MRNIVLYITDIAIMVGCCLGVGFVSGKEAQVFFGNTLNVVIFTLLYAACNIVLRLYCNKAGCNSVETLSKSLFKKGASAFEALICLCCFVCIVTMLAGAEACLDRILHLSNLPLYALVCAVISAIALAKGDKALKIANVVSITLAIIFVIVMLLGNKQNTSARNSVSPIKPIIYALFSAAVSFGVTTRLGFESDVKRNVVCPVAAAVILALLMIAVIKISDFSLQLPTIDSINDIPTQILAIVTLTLAAVTGIVACAYPIVEQIYPVIPDNPLCCSVVFGLALAFSMFGFDFAVKIGYALVGIVGLVTIVIAIVQLFGKSNRVLYKSRSSLGK